VCTAAGWPNPSRCFATAANRPSQDAGQFGPQLVGQVTIAFGGRNLDGEGNDAHPTPEGGVGAADPRPVVGDEPQLELGLKRGAEPAPRRSAGNAAWPCCRAAPAGPSLRRHRLPPAAVKRLADELLLDFEVCIEIGVAHRDVVHLSAR
jgi:hypothetical protein